MKAFCASFALISSLASVHGCTLESCALREIRNCAFNDNSCRGKETLDLRGKSLSGVIPVAFYTLLGTTLQGNADEGIPPVKLKKVYMQSNALTQVENLFACLTIQEINLEGNPLSSTQTIGKPSNVVTLNLAKTSQTNVKWLQSKVPNLKTLNLANNEISDLSPLASMKKLTSLDLRGNKKITDLTPLVELTGLTDLKVEAPLQKQASIIASKSSAATKRSQIVSAEIGTIQQVAVTNKASIEEIKTLASTIPALTEKNKNLEARIKSLEEKLAQLNQACFASATGSRRQLSSDCIEDGAKVDGATATSILSVATVASAASIFL